MQNDDDDAQVVDADPDPDPDSVRIPAAVVVHQEREPEPRLPNRRSSFQLIISCPSIICAGNWKELTVG